MREAVIAATVAELEESGYARLSIAAVAARAGVHETSIYRRWKTREKLVVEATFALFARSIVVADRGSLIEDLLALLVALGRQLKSPLGISAIQLAAGSADDPDIDRALREQWTIRFQTIRQVFERAIARGEWPPEADPLPPMQCAIGVVYLRVLILKAPVTRAHLRRCLRASSSCERRPHAASRPQGVPRAHRVRCLEQAVPRAARTGERQVGKNRFFGRGRPRFSRSVRPSYSRRKMPRRCSSGTTLSTKSSRPSGR